MIISLDTETTGIDFVHGAKPFIVTTCCDEYVTRCWEWDVDPLTREPQIPDGDLADIAELIDAADLIYLQGAKFDARALATIGLSLPWPKVRDTLVASHILATNHAHDLTSLCKEYLDEDILPYELLVKEVVQKCRAIVKRMFSAWRLAAEGAPGMPSVKQGSKRDEDKPWKNDMWLPRALAKQYGENPGTGEDWDNWLTAASAYANVDSSTTLPLGLELEKRLRHRGLWSIYEHRLQLPRAACEMESYGVTAVGEYTHRTISEYEEHIAESEAALVCIAAEYGHELELASGATLNDNMRDFFYGAVHQRCPRCDYTRRIKHWNGEDVLEDDVCPKCFKGTKRRAGMRHRLLTERRANLSLPVVESKKTGNATLDKDSMQDYVTTLDEGAALDFISILSSKRNYDTALSYMHAYRRFWVPVLGCPGFYRVHPSLNPCGTDHLRWSSSNPNLQNVAGESKELSNRACFGPMPHREWWSMDFKSIERRIPAYESGEPKMVEVFERPNEPPYWGNLYNLTASVLYPEEYWPRAEVEGLFRKDCPRLYKQAKFFDLAKQYGCGRRKGDLLSRIKNSFDLVDNEFPLMARLQAKYLTNAERRGYVETLPDRSVDPTRGYPILASRTDDGRVLSTTPFNYHVSGTACWAKNTALVRCAEQCRAWRDEGFDAWLVLEVHDELLFDFPRGATMEENLPSAVILRGLMEQSGEDLIPRIPTPVSVKYHTQSWAEGVAV